MRVRRRTLTATAHTQSGQCGSINDSTKGARRYRYYIRQAIAETPALRIPAQELEDAVLEALAGFLRDEARLTGLRDDLSADVTRSRLQGAAALAQRLSALAGDRVALLRRLVARIAVGTNSIEIAVRTEAIWSGEALRVGAESVNTIVVPAQLRRCGRAVRLIVRAPGKVRAPDPRLVALLAKAQRWFTSLSSGRSDSVLSIAQEYGQASKDVTRVLYLAFLAPDIVERFVRGEQAIDLAVKRLLAMAPLPMDWAEQPRVLGFEH